MEVLGEVAGFIYFWVQKKKEAGACLQDGLSFSSVVYFGRRWVCLDLTVLCLQLWAFPKQTDEG